MTTSQQLPSAPLASFTNTEHGVTAFVFAATRGGFNVTVRDDDAGEFLPDAICFSDLGRAIAKARHIVNQ